MDDLISRQAAIDALRKMQTYKLFAGDDIILVDKAQAQTELMMLPPVQPERKDDTNINIGKKNFTESGKLHTIDKECARRYLEGKIFFGFIIDAFNRIINRINEIEDVINQIRGLNFCPNCGADMRQTGDENV